MAFSLDLGALPAPFDVGMATRNLDRWQDWTKAEPDLSAALSRRLEDDAAARALMVALFGNSPFLSQCLLAEPGVLEAMLKEGPDASFDRLIGNLRREADAELDTARLMRLLRIAKRRAALLIGMADIAGVWTLKQVTAALSTLAEAALSLGLSHLLRKAHEQGDIVLPDPARPEEGSGVVVIGMGKLGAVELNYSSDIDIIVFYDSDRIDYRGRRSVQEMCVKMTRELVRLMEERTADGYVFRTDLRLRPDPGSTPPAISLLAAETYYEGFGQNWERAAMIKARPVAGDRTAGDAFLTLLNPFIWRKYLDFATIQDIHSIKRQINAHRGGGRIAIAGHNIKLGRGGIREIEFFAQTQQLIWGGRDFSLRTSRTLEALAALNAAGHVTQEASDALSEAYGFLRRVEHRLQMIDDQQTQTLPNTPEKLAALGVFLGYAGEEDFAAALETQLRRVEHHYARLFEDAPSLAGDGDLVFTGGSDDPGTLKTLAGMGFSDPAAVSGDIRGWHHGRIRATRSARAREMLTELTPALLKALAGSGEPDLAFRRFSVFLTGLPAGVPLFSMFKARPGLLDFLAEIMGDAPRIADALSARPRLLDGVLSRDFFEPLGPLPTLREDLERMLVQAGEDFQELLDSVRRWASEQKFRIGVQILRNQITPDQSSRHLTDIAEAVLGAVQDFVEREFRRLHGGFAGPGAAIVAMGKMGGREMTPSSDLDLILIYETDPGQDQSDGARPLDPSVYYARLTQRIINALTVKTAEGTLYEVDMRLRPSGSSGPIAASLESFIRYHDSMAWTWEHMALTRARIVSGRPELAAKIEAVIRRTLSARRDPDRLVVDVMEMHERIRRQHGTDNPWDVKYRTGGLIAIEFIAQYLQLRWASDCPTLLHTATRDVLKEAGRLGLIGSDDAGRLDEALGLWSAIGLVLRQTLDGPFDEKGAPERVLALLAQAAGQPGFAQLTVWMDECAAAVAAVFARLIEEPARAILSAATKEN